MFWEFRHRHRWGFTALAGYFVILAMVRVGLAAAGRTAVLDTSESFAMVVVVPLSATVLYLLSVFSFGLHGDIAARQSIYPSRLFTLPVTTAALAGWPMLYGSLAMAAVWLALRAIGFWPESVPVPTIWPALMAAVLLAWTQALTWMPYGLPGLRVIVAVFWLTVFDTTVLVALYRQASETVMVAILAPLLPLAYVVAVSAVRRARRGDVPDWRGAFAWLGRLADPGRGRGRFRSSAQAQVWLEWRRHGLSLPALVGMVLPFELLLLFAAGGALGLVHLVLVLVLVTPPFMASFTAATVRKSNAGGAEHGVSPFMATRPLPSSALVAAKLKVAARSTLFACGIVFLFTPVGLRLSGTLGPLLDWMERVVGVIGLDRALMLGVLVVLAIVASTFKQVVQSLYVGLSGREWLVKGSGFATLVFFVVLGPVLQWIDRSAAARSWLWDAIPWILAALVTIKVCAAGWVAVRLYDARLVRDRMLLGGAAGWLLIVLAVYGMLVWLVDTPLFPSYVLLLAAILMTPLARVAAAPVALAWNRHR